MGIWTRKNCSTGLALSIIEANEAGNFFVSSIYTMTPSLATLVSTNNNCDKKPILPLVCAYGAKGHPCACLNRL